MTLENEIFVRIVQEILEDKPLKEFMKEFVKQLDYNELMSDELIIDSLVETQISLLI